MIRPYDDFKTWYIYLISRYECKESDGNFMVAFPDCCGALEWAMTLQLALMELNWPEELQRMDVCSDAYDPDSSQVETHPSRCSLESRMKDFIVDIH